MSTASTLLEKFFEILKQQRSEAKKAASVPDEKYELAKEKWRLKDQARADKGRFMGWLSGDRKGPLPEPTYEGLKKYISSEKLKSIQLKLENKDEKEAFARLHAFGIRSLQGKFSADSKWNLYAAWCTDTTEWNIMRKLYCCRLDQDLLNTPFGARIRTTEGQLELKLALGDHFQSSIKSLNKQNNEQLRDQLKQLRLKKIEAIRQKFLKKRPNKSHLSILVNDPGPEEVAHTLCYNGQPFSNLVPTMEDMCDKLEVEYLHSARPLGWGSFPERFVAALLDIAKIEYKREVVFPWSKGNPHTGLGNKRFDFFIPKHNAIIEVQGSQHFYGGFENMGGRTLEEEIANDTLKRNMALNNKISLYIEIDAKESDFSYLKKSTSQNNKLAEIINFSELNFENVLNRLVQEEKAEQSKEVLYTEIYRNYFQGWIEVIKETELPSDSVIHASTLNFGRGVLNDFTKACLESNELNEVEYDLFNEAHTFTACQKYETVHWKWHEYSKVTDVFAILKKLVNLGLLELENSQTAIENHTMAYYRSLFPENKRFIPNRKAEAVQKLLSSFNEDELLKLFPNRHYQPTKAGLKLLYERLPRTEIELLQTMSEYAQKSEDCQVDNCWAYVINGKKVLIRDKLEQLGYIKYTARDPNPYGYGNRATITEKGLEYLKSLKKRKKNC